MIKRLQQMDEKQLDRIVDRMIQKKENAMDLHLALEATSTTIMHLVLDIDEHKGELVLNRDCPTLPGLVEGLKQFSHRLHDISEHQSGTNHFIEYGSFS